MSGWFAVARKVFNHEMFGGEPFSKREAWLYLIAITQFEGPDRGTFSASERELARVFRWDRSRVHRFLSKLIDKTMIEPASEPKSNQDRTTYRTTNYEQYQIVDSDGAPGRNRNSNRNRTTNRTTLIDKDLNKLNNNKNNTPQPPQGVPEVLPKALETQEFRAALGLWFQHKRELPKSKPYTKPGLAALISKLEKLGSARAVTAIYHSMALGWEGIYEQNESRKEQVRPQPALFTAPPPVTQKPDQRRAMSLLTEVNRKIAESKK